MTLRPLLDWFAMYILIAGIFGTAVLLLGAAGWIFGTIGFVLMFAGLCTVIKCGFDRLLDYDIPEADEHCAPEGIVVPLKGEGRR